LYCNLVHLSRNIILLFDNEKLFFWSIVIYVLSMLCKVKVFTAHNIKEVIIKHSIFCVKKEFEHLKYGIIWLNENIFLKRNRLLQCRVNIFTLIKNICIIPNLDQLVLKYFTFWILRFVFLIDKTVDMIQLLVNRALWITKKREIWIIIVIGSINFVSILIKTK